MVAIPDGRGLRIEVNEEYVVERAQEAASISASRFHPRSTGSCFGEF